MSNPLLELISHGANMRNIMKSFRCISLLALCFSSSSCGAADSGPNGQGVEPKASQSSSSKVSANASASYSPKTTPLPEATMCSKPDKVVFSCPLDKTKKVVSVCMADRAGQKRFYYSFGYPPVPELSYPSSGDENEVLHRSHLSYAGATGGTAYSFIKDGYKYIAYLISGTGFDTGGVLVQRSGDTRAISNLKCSKGSITESDDDTVFNASTKLERDEDIDSHGLPSVN